MTWRTKLPLLFMLIMAILYTILWLKVTSDMQNSINLTISGRPLHISPSHRAQFTKATAKGFPFVFGVALHEFTEDNPKAIIHHESPVFIGYNIVTQELFMEYEGSSIINFRSEGHKQNFISNGSFRYSATLPISFATLSNPVITKDTPIEILSNMRHVKVDIKNSSLLDSIENKKLIDNSNLTITLDVGHHRSYKDLQELTNDIPRDYDVSVKIHNQIAPTMTSTIPFSIIYGAYIPFSINYQLKTSLHTDASKFTFSDISKGISFRNWESSMHNDYEESSSIMNLSANILDGNINFNIDDSSMIKIRSSYAKNLDATVKKLVTLMPTIIGTHAGSIARQLDLAALNLDTQDDSISVDFKGSLNYLDQANDLLIELPHLGVKFRDIAFDFKNMTKINFKDIEQWASSGVISANQYEALVQYLISSYFTMYHLPQNIEFNDQFYLKMFLDFIRKIANNITHDNNNITIEYDFQQDVTKAKLGKFGLTESTLLYYATLLKHVTAVSKNIDEAMVKFKTMVPDYVLEQESLDKIVLQSKEN